MYFLTTCLPIIMTHYEQYSNGILFWIILDVELEILILLIVILFIMNIPHSYLVDNLVKLIEEA